MKPFKRPQLPYSSAYIIGCLYYKIHNPGEYMVISDGVQRARRRYHLHQTLFKHYGMKYAEFNMTLAGVKR